jgi:hypothetical protein
LAGAQAAREEISGSRFGLLGAVVGLDEPHQEAEDARVRLVVEHLEQQNVGHAALALALFCGNVCRLKDQVQNVDLQGKGAAFGLKKVVKWTSQSVFRIWVDKTDMKVCAPVVEDLEQQTVGHAALPLPLFRSNVPGLEKRVQL